MPVNQMIWSEAWHRASREEIGICLTVDNPRQCVYHLHMHRPAGYQDYTCTRTVNANTIYIIKPGVTMDDPDVLRELGITPDLEE